MTSYLIENQDPAVNSGDIAAELGIDLEQFRGTIESTIAFEAARSTKPVSVSIWAVDDGPDFAKRCERGGVPPVAVALATRTLDKSGRLFRDCRYEPDPEAVATLRQKVLRRLRNSSERDLVMALNGRAA